MPDRRSSLRGDPDDPRHEKHKRERQPSAAEAPEHIEALPDEGDHNEEVSMPSIIVAPHSAQPTTAWPMMTRTWTMDQSMPLLS